MLRSFRVSVPSQALASLLLEEGLAADATSFGFSAFTGFGLSATVNAAPELSDEQLVSVPSQALASLLQ